MDNNTGRFISRDPIKDGYNWYAYCAGNPISYVDPTGLKLVMVGGDQKKNLPIDGATKILREGSEAITIYDNVYYYHDTGTGKSLMVKSDGSIIDLSQAVSHSSLSTGFSSNSSSSTTAGGSNSSTSLLNQPLRTPPSLEMTASVYLIR